MRVVDAELESGERISIFDLPGVEQAVFILRNR